jgi:hypothetical protein
MSNGPDFIGAYDACRAARRDIREMEAEEGSAKAHFKQAHKESQNADKAETRSDSLHHTFVAKGEQIKGESASQRADQHRQDAFEHLGQYNARMGHDPREGTPGDCNPFTVVRDHRAGAVADDILDKAVTDVLHILNSHL